MFDKIRQAVSHVAAYLGFQQMPQNIPPHGVAPNAPMPGALSSFIEAATTPGPSQDWLMGSLRDRGVNPQDFGRFCASFAEGALYIYRRFGTVPAGIMVVDMAPGEVVYYNQKTQNIFISRDHIGRCLEQYILAEDKFKPYALTPMQYAVMSGVEEAYHHYQMTAARDHYLPLMDQYRKPAEDVKAYMQHPLEADAKKIVQEALIDFGFDRMPVAPVYDATWQARIAERQQTQAQAPQVS